MDENKAISQVVAAYEKLLRQSGRIQALEKKLIDGTITMKEGAELNDLRAQAFGRAFSGSVTGIDRGSREGACVDLLKDRCADVDELAQAAQRAVLARQGLNLTPPTASFEEDRARKIGHSLEDETVPDETIQRRARSATENMLKSQYDRNMKQGAKTCASAGLKTYIIRDSGAGCCKWCDEVAGKFVYGTEPKDVYRRHDNCSCSVVYESGRGRQNVWSKQTWSREQEQKYLELRDKMKLKKMNEAPKLNKPMRLTKKEIAELMKQVKALTNGADSGIIEERPIKTVEEARSFFQSIFASVEKNISQLDERLVVDNANRLKKLNDRFGVLTSDNMGYISGSKQKEVASTLYSIARPDDSLILSSRYYDLYERLVATEKRWQNDFYSMPVPAGELSTATITHEYGHMLEHKIIRERMGEEAFWAYDTATNYSLKKSAKEMLEKEEKARAKAIFDEIMAIAKERNPSFSLKDNLGKYGHKDHFEFFAECFMNSQYENPNELGKAMNIWLERNGYQ